MMSIANVAADVFPVLTGMNREAQPSCLARCGVPRTHGDEPGYYLCKRPTL